MKRYIGIATVAIVMIIVSCKKDKVASGYDFLGSYKVWSFVDNDTVRTTEFALYTITFNSNGEINVDSAGIVKICSWWKTASVYHFNMDGMNNSYSTINELTGDWMMSDSNDTICNFMDDSPSRKCMFTLRLK